MSSNNSPKNPLATIIKWAVAADIVWALLAATFNAVVFSGIGTAADMGSTTTTIGTVALWLMTFVVALFQGAITIVVISVFVFVIAALVKSAKNK